MAVAKPDGDMPNVGEPSGVGEATPPRGGSAALPSPDAPIPTGPSTGRWLYADKPLEPGDKDPLGFGAYADALALLMDGKNTSTPLTIAINGPWGSGKTSLAKMAEARLPIGSDWDAPHVTCWFDAWANDDAPHLGAAFAAAVAKGVNRHRRWWVRLVMPLPSVMLSPERRWWRRLWFGVLAVALAAIAIFWPTGGSLLTPFTHAGATVSSMGHGTAATRLAWPLLAVAVIVLAQGLAPSIQGVARWIDNPGSEAARGSMQDAKRQLGRLINQALRGKRRLMIFVDNLERCRPPRAVEVCEVVSQLIGHPQVVTVLIGDMDTIALSAEIKYAALESITPGTSGTPGPGGTPGTFGVGPAGAYGRAYLEKLIQIQLRLPPPLLGGLRNMLVPVAGERPAFPQNADEREPQFLAERAQYAVIPPRRRLLMILLGSIVVVGSTFLINLSTGQNFGIPTWLWVVGGVAAGSVAAIIWSYVAERNEERRRERARIALDKAVYSEVEATEKTLRPDAVENVAYQVSNIDEWEIRRRIRQRITYDSELRDELDRAVLEVLPLSPRAAKRMLNHAHLLLGIGFERGIFDTQPGLQAGQLAAWVALTERWPSVAAAITSDPTLIGRLEEAARQTGPDLRPDQFTTIEKETGITGLDSSLLEYLRRTDSLMPYIRMLVNFAPDTDGAVALTSAGPVRRQHQTGPSHEATPPGGLKDTASERQVAPPTVRDCKPDNNGIT